ncbi:hypothetical protein C1H46_026757 [Malus baccata]|uniref:C2 domain-containing protein n=1 Tax=Malus baccata TaxID=106549 RepID=A0A540LMI0_MALBA|nr:hypothetical protein C1H46_026757 [Malus baccata]
MASTKLVVEVHDASDLMPKDGDRFASPFVEVDFKGQRKRTQTKPKDLNLYWNETLTTHLTSPTRPSTLSFTMTEKLDTIRISLAVCESLATPSLSPSLRPPSNATCLINAATSPMSKWRSSSTSFHPCFTRASTRPTGFSCLPSSAPAVTSTFSAITSRSNVSKNLPSNPSGLLVTCWRNPTRKMLPPLLVGWSLRIPRVS